MPVAHVVGPSQAGPGERAEMLAKARSFLEGVGVDAGDIVRIDVPGRGAGEEGEGNLRAELEPVVPMLQSGSLFGGVQGLELVDAHQLLAAEAEILAELLTGAPEGVAVAFVSEGSVPAALRPVLKESATTVTVKRIYESGASRWLTEEVERRGLRIDPEAVKGLVQRFGTDTSSLGHALDQLAEVDGRITADIVAERFRNRPNEPVWHYTDAVAKGDTGEALRRLGDLMVHLHPLAILASLERELTRRAIALSASDEDTFRELVGARPSDRWATIVWKQRGRLKDSGLRQGLDALVRADRLMKSAPEELHRVTLERLTVALCRWMSP